MDIGAGYTLLSLKSVLENRGREKVEAMLSEFVPVHNDSSPAQFLREKAIMMELKGLSRTHLAVDNDFRIIGFFTLSMKCMKIPKENLLSNSMLKSMNIESSTGVAQSYLLGQICRSADSPSGFGRNLIDRAIELFRICNDNVGCRMIRLDCNDDMVGYYRNCGFKQICKNHDGSLNQMMTLLK